IRDRNVTGVQTCALPIYVYQLQNQIPVLKAHTGIPQWWSLSDNRGVLTVIPLSENAPAGYVEILIFDITSGSIVSRDFNILLPRSEERRVGKECSSGRWT